MEFEWDAGNIAKISLRFFLWQVEEFFEQELLVIEDSQHSTNELRFIAVGKGPHNKPMFVCFTLRGTKIRVISARFMREKELKRYEAFKEKN